MRKRLRKKWHRKWISDVRIEVSMHDQLVQLVFAAKSKKIEINRDNAKIWIPWADWISQEIISRNLRFYVWIDSPSIDLIDSEVEGHPLYTFFYLEFCSVEFPSIKAWAAQGLAHFRWVAAKNQKLER